MSFANDTFTEVSDTAIASHTPDSGGSWTQHPGASNGATVIGSEDRVRGDSDAASTFCYHSADPAANEYDVEGILRRTGTSSVPLPRLAGRMSTAANTRIELLLDEGLGEFRLSEVSGGSVSEASAYATTWTADTDYTFKLAIRNGTNGVKGYLNGVQRVQVTGDVVTAAGKAGFGSRLYGRVDSWVATDAGGGLSIPVAMNQYRQRWA